MQLYWRECVSYKNFQKFANASRARYHRNIDVFKHFHTIIFCEADNSRIVDQSETQVTIACDEDLLEKIWERRGKCLFALTVSWDFVKCVTAHRVTCLKRAVRKCFEKAATHEHQQSEPGWAVNLYCCLSVASADLASVACSHLP